MLPQIMGVLNVTSDSFSDGGKFVTLDAAVSAGLRMTEDGAAIIDVGGESTRPGARPVSQEEELARVLPVVAELVRRGVKVSVDTSKPEVARRCLDLGARMVNDVTGLRDPEMIRVCAEAKCRVVAMHMQGDPTTMQVSPAYDDVVREVKEFLLLRAARAIVGGIARDMIILDPGIGFGKTVEHNLALLRNLRIFVQTGFPVLLGVSRKGFIGKVLGDVPLESRLEGTLAIHAYAQLQGVSMLRTHDVASAVKTARMILALGPLA